MASNYVFGKPQVAGQLQAWFPHTVTIHPYVSEDAYGEESYGTSRLVKAYVPPSVTYNRASGRYETSTPLTAIVNDFHVGIRDKITLPDGHETIVVSVDTHDYMPGSSHTAVRFS